MADANSSMTLNNIEVTVDKVYDVTMSHSRPGGVILHADNAWILLSAEVLADIDQARAEAAADARIDAEQAGL